MGDQGKKGEIESGGGSHADSAYGYFWGKC
jgi:hypothetical protein